MGIQAYVSKRLHKSEIKVNHEAYIPTTLLWGSYRTVEIYWGGGKFATNCYAGVMWKACHTDIPEKPQAKQPSSIQNCDMLECKLTSTMMRTTADRTWRVERWPT